MRPEEFSRLSLEILRLNPNALSRLQCSECLTAARNKVAGQPVVVPPPTPPARVEAPAPSMSERVEAPPPAVWPPVRPPAAQAPAPPPPPPTVAAVAAIPAASKPAAEFSAADAFDLGEAILETSTIAPSEVGDESDDDLEDVLAEVGLVGGEEDDGLDDPKLAETVWGRASVHALARANGNGHGPANAPGGRLLTAEALEKHNQRTDVIERRQFNCAQHGTFWQKVLARKPVARCAACGDNGPKYEPIAVEEVRPCAVVAVAAAVRFSLCGGGGARWWWRCVVVVGGWPWR